MKCCSCSFGICEEKNCRLSFFSPCFSFSPIPLENRNGSTPEKKYLRPFFILFILPDDPKILGPYWKWSKFHKNYRQSMVSTNMAINYFVVTIIVIVSISIFVIMGLIRLSSRVFWARGISIFHISGAHFCSYPWLIATFLPGRKLRFCSLRQI